MEIQHSHGKEMLFLGKNTKIALLPPTAIALTHCPPPLTTATVGSFPTIACHFQTVTGHFLTTASHFSAATDHFSPTSCYHRSLFGNYGWLFLFAVSHSQGYFWKYIQYQPNIKISRFLKIQFAFQMHLNVIRRKAGKAFQQWKFILPIKHPHKICLIGSKGVFPLPPKKYYMQGTFFL